MEPDDDADLAANPPTISTRPPFLPPCTPDEAKQAIFASPHGMAAALMGTLPAAHTGLASMIGYSGPQAPDLTGPGLAGALLSHGLSAVPGCDPRLVNVTTDHGTPSFQTAKGTVIQVNHPAPQTLLPEGAGMDNLIAFADNTGKNPVTITGGSEKWIPDGKGGLKRAHSTNSEHYDDNAIDVGGPAVNKDLDAETVRQAALAAGYTHGMYEVHPNELTHWHLQVGPDNIVNAPAYDLRNGPIRTKVYTKVEKKAMPDGVRGS